MERLCHLEELEPADQSVRQSLSSRSAACPHDLPVCSPAARRSGCGVLGGRWTHCICRFPKHPIATSNKVPATALETCNVGVSWSLSGPSDRSAHMASTHPTGPGPGCDWGWGCACGGIRRTCARFPPTDPDPLPPAARKRAILNCSWCKKISTEPGLDITICSISVLLKV